MKAREKEKMSELLTQARSLLQNHVTSSDMDFKKWHLRTEKFLKAAFGEESDEFKRFNARNFSPIMLSSSMDKHERHILYEKACTDDLNNTISDFDVYLECEDDEEDNEMNQNKHDVEKNHPFDKVFVVHGHDGELKLEVARLLEKQNIQAVILSEQANQGKTIIEKIENYSDVGAAIILFTCDDLGRAKEAKDDKSRARQNVIFEAGYFMGLLGRDRTIIIHEEGIEIPSDLNGLVYTDKGNWEINICKELKAIGFSVDMNKLF